MVKWWINMDECGWMWMNDGWTWINVDEYGWIRMNVDECGWSIGIYCSKACFSFRQSWSDSMFIRMFFAATDLHAGDPKERIGMQNYQTVLAESDKMSGHVVTIPRATLQVHHVIYVWVYIYIYYIHTYLSMFSQREREREKQKKWFVGLISVLCLFGSC